MSDRKRQEYWLPCPVCKGKTRTRVHEDITLVNFPLFCPKCKSVTRVLEVILTFSNDERSGKC